MRKAQFRIGLAAGLVAGALLSQAASAQAPPPGVFSEIPTAVVPSVSPALEPATVRSRVVRVDTQKITAARRGREVLQLNLFDDAVVEVDIKRVRPTRNGYFIFGTPRGKEWGDVRLVVNGPVMVGTVSTPEGEYTIRSAGSGRHMIRQVDPNAVPLECEVETSSVPAASPITERTSLPAVASIGAGGAGPAVPSVQTFGNPTEDGSEVRVLMVYTSALQAAQGGAAGMRALIDLMIQSANQAFEDSGINPRLVLAHAHMVDYVAQDIKTDIARMQDPDDGHMDEVHQLRNDHAADLVHLLTNVSTGAVGGARLPIGEALTYGINDAFAATAHGRVDTFVHEIGHNFGLMHDRVEGDPDIAVYPYAFGYANKAAFEADHAETARWRTVMTTWRACREADVPCERLLRFSNPDQSYLGDPLGVAADDPVRGLHGPADARLTINNMAKWVGSYRSEACDNFDLSAEALVLPVSGGEISAAVAVDTWVGCVWDATADADFATVTSPRWSAGSGAMHIQVEPNRTGEERSGTLTVAGKTITVRQLATEEGICGRSTAVLNAITKAIGKTPEQCAEITQDELAQVEDLNFYGLGLASLQTGDFSGLTGLEGINLARNKLTKLPEDLFAGLPSLEQLYLNFNEIKSLPKGLFAGLSNLGWLDLCCGELAELPEGAFAGLTSLEYLGLNSGELTELPPRIFQGLSSLEILELGGNEITEFAPGTFDGLTRLRWLKIGHNEVSSLPEGLFADLSSLTYLVLGGNPLRRLSGSLFSNLASLEELDLVNSGLQELPEELFAGLSKLDFIQMQTNELKTLPKGLFSGLTNLRELRLSHNLFGVLPDGVFSDLSGLEILLMNSSKLPKVQEGLLTGLTRLRNLDLGYSHVASIEPGAFSDLGALESLDLKFNDLTSLPSGAFAGLSELKTLILDDNYIIEIPGGIFADLTSLETLSLGSMKLRHLPEGMFSGLAGLKEVDLEGNDVTKLPLRVHIEKLGENQLKAIAPTGAPFPLTLPVNLSAGGTIEGNSDSVTIPIGATESPPLTVLREEGREEAINADFGALPDLPGPHRGYELLKDESLPARMLPSLEATDATLADLSVTAGEMAPSFAENRATYTALVPNAASTVTVVPTPGNANASVEFQDSGEQVLEDADASEDGQQLNLAVGENTVRVKVTSEDGSSTQTYTLVITRDSGEDVCLRTAPVGDAIRDAAGVASCGEVTAAHLADIRELTIEYAEFASLRPGDLAGLTSIEKIRIAYSGMNALPANVFVDLPALVELDLRGNDFSTLSAGTLSELASLETLVISSNRMVTLPPDLFAELSNLKAIDIGANRFRRMEAGLFGGLSGLAELELYGCALSILPEDMFDDLGALETLDLRGNRLRDLPDGVSGLTRLTELYLGGNQLSTLPQGAFARLGRLDVLDLSDNWFRSLPQGIFAGLPALKQLDLQENTVDPLPLAVSLEKAGGSQFKAVAPTGVPFNVAVSVSVSDTGEIEGGADSITIPAGKLESAPVGVTRIAGTEEEPVTVNIPSLPTLPENHQGYVFEKDGSLPRRIIQAFSDRSPDQVTGVEVVAGSAQLEVSWTTVPDAEGYKVQWKSGEEDYDDARQGVVSGGETTTFTITGLTAGTEYTVRVIATGDGVEDGEPSSEVTGTPKAAAPSRVTGVAISAGVDDLTVMWTAVSDADGYKVQWKSGDEDYDEAREGLVTASDTTTYTITGLITDTEYTVRVIATKDNADDGPASEEITATLSSADPDVNGDGTLDGNDALIMYNAYESEAQLGDGKTGGSAASRQTLLAGYSGKTNPTDDELKEMIRKSLAWRDVGAGAGGDINEDGAIDESDALVMYYAYTTANLVGDGETGGTARFRQLLLASFAGKDNPTDEDLKAMLRRANELRDDFG